MRAPAKVAHSRWFDKVLVATEQKEGRKSGGKIGENEGVAELRLIPVRAKWEPHVFFKASLIP